MNPAIFQQPFFSVALPIMVTLFIGIWSQNKRFDDINLRMGDLNARISDGNKRMDDLSTSLNKRIDDLSGSLNRRLDEIIERLGRIEAKLENHEDRLVRLEERTSPIGKALR